MKIVQADGTVTRSGKLLLEQLQAMTAVSEVPSGKMDGSNTVFTLSDTPAEGTLYLNGVEQIPGVDYTLNGMTLTFAVAPRASDIMMAQYTPGNPPTGSAKLTPAASQRGNIDYDQIRAPARYRTGTQFQMFGGGSVTPGHFAVYDANGNIIDGGLAPGGAPGSSSFVQANISSGGASSVAFTAANTAGNLIVVAALTYNAPLLVNDTAGNTYTEISSEAQAGGDYTTVWYAKNILAGSNTVTVAGTMAILIITEYTAIASVAPVDVYSASLSNSQSVSTTQNNDLLVFVAANSNNSSASSGNPWTETGGYTQREYQAGIYSGTPRTMSLWDSTAASAGAHSDSASVPGTGNPAGFLIAFKSAPVSAGAVTSVFGRTGAVVAATGDYTAAEVTNAVSSTGAYPNPTWITSLAWSKITGTPAIGSVTSVAMTVPSRQSVTGSPVTTSGTLAISDNAQSPNLVFAGPSSGASATPTFRALAAADLPSGVGTVTSVGLSMPAEFAVSGSPVTASGSFSVTKNSQSANMIYASPSGAAGLPAFRSLVTADLPAGTGTVTSVALAAPAEFTVSGSPVTASGTLTFAKASQAANLIYASPSGASGIPAFRAHTAADFPSAVITALQTPWLSNINAANFYLYSVSQIGIGMTPAIALDIVSTLTPQIRVTNSGTSAQAQLAIQGAGAPFLRFWSDNVPTYAANIAMGGPGSAAISDLTFSMYASAAWTERMRLTNAGALVVGSSVGQIGIGTTPGASYALDILSASNTYIRIMASASSPQAHMGVISSGPPVVRFFSDGVATYGAAVGMGLVSGPAIGDLVFSMYGSGAWAERMRLTNAGGFSISNLPSTAPAAGTKQLWYDPADSNRVKFAV